MKINKPGFLTVIVEYGESHAEAIARVKKEHPDFDEKQGYIFVVDFKNSLAHDSDEQTD
jgi:hypothetical protein